MWEPFQQTTRGIPFRGMLRKDYSWQGIYMNLLSIAFSPVKRLVQLILVGPKLTTTWVPENLSFRANLKCLMSQFSGVEATPKQVYKPQKSSKMFLLLMIIGQQNDKIEPEDDVSMLSGACQAGKMNQTGPGQYSSGRRGQGKIDFFNKV